MNVCRLSLMILAAAASIASAQTSFWSPSALPAVGGASDTASVTLGLAFYSDVPGVVTGVRFYKGPSNGGSHTGNLWSGTGTKLASVTFSGETASGWQQANFTTPVNINASTKYVISYTAPQGGYAYDQSFDWSRVSSSPLHVSGATPGVYVYGGAPAFPNQVHKGTNYWVDVVFASSSTTTYSVSGSVYGTSATLSLTGSSTATTTSDSSGNYSFAGLPNGSYTITASKSGYTFTPPSRSLTISGGNVTGADFTGSAVVSTPSVSFWPTSTTPATIQENDPTSVTLGLRFYSDVAGTVQGVRFYKSSANTGTHIGTLWSSTGTALASATFSGETASGWQQVNFASPVAIAANTNYTVSYSAPRGYYSVNEAFAWSSITTSSLHVAGTSPGVYTYGASNAFPQSSYNSSNYWVDLIFTPSGSPAATYTISGTVQGASATLTVSGPIAASTTTNSSGAYSFSGLPNGQYVISASQPGYTFSPSLASVTVNGSNVSGTNFVATATPTPVPHSVTLNWAPSTTSGLKGYNVYRSDVGGGSYVKVGTASSTTFVDSTVASGRTYYYVATAVDGNNVESTYSNEAPAVVPTP